MILETDFGVCIGGFKAAGIKGGKHGVALIVSDRICDAVGVFTKNTVKAAPLLVTRKKLKNGIHAIIANSGNANACTKTGLRDAEEMCRVAAKSLRIDAKNVAVASTGIIGRPLNLEIIKNQVARISKNLGKTSKSAARAIMTTDTKPKQVSVEYKGIRIGGIAKGAGMISPNMATMLCFLTTNADLRRGELQKALKDAVEDNFNMLSVDNCMSTNDMVLLLSNKTKKCSASDFRKALNFVTRKLAVMIARDGEGSTKYVEVTVKGAKSKAEARKGAKAVVSSDLFKTMIYGKSANFGRIVSALGSVIKVDFKKMRIRFSSKKGSAVTFDNGRIGNLKKAVRILEDDEIFIDVNLRHGRESATAFGCDLTEGYVRINARYS